MTPEAPMNSVQGPPGAPEPGGRAWAVLAVTRPPKGVQEKGDTKCSSRATEMSPGSQRQNSGRCANTGNRKGALMATSTVREKWHLSQPRRGAISQRGI